MSYTTTSVLTPEELTPEDRKAYEEMRQFLRWAGPPEQPRPTVTLAWQWYDGLLTIEEGLRIETGRQVWQQGMEAAI